MSNVCGNKYKGMDWTCKLLKGHEGDCDYHPPKQTALQGAIWNKMNGAERTKLLRRAYPDRANSIVSLESKLRWNKLLPSTQQKLEGIDWAAALRDPGKTGAPHGA